MSTEILEFNLDYLFPADHSSMDEAQTRNFLFISYTENYKAIKTLVAIIYNSQKPFQNYIQEYHLNIYHANRRHLWSKLNGLTDNEENVIANLKPCQQCIDEKLQELKNLYQSYCYEHRINAS
jgi:hypothetical protein